MKETALETDGQSSPGTGIRQYFSPRAKIQARLEVEVALAEVQAELGMIPPHAAEEIARKGHLRCLDEAALQQDIARTRAPIVSLVRFLARACDGDAGSYVHWGATTQNVMQTADVLIMRRTHTLLLGRLAGCLEALAGLAEQGADMAMAGRTQRRQALPITFGFKAAVWIDELLRHEERLRGAEQRVFTLIFGGAVGAMHAFGAMGPKLNRRLAERLALGYFEIPSRTANDQLVEYVLLLAMLGASCGKIAQELYLLMSDEFGEVMEGLGNAVIGSSTMPHKVNSKVAVSAIALSAQIRAQVGLALEATQISHEGDGAMNQMMYAAMDNACPLAYDLLTAMEELLQKLLLVPERMRANLELTAGQINCEHVMMELAKAGGGRQWAHDVVHDAVLQATASNRSIEAVLCGNAQVTAIMSVSDIRAALLPAAYTGECSNMARGSAVRAREGASRIRGAWPTGPTGPTGPNGHPVPEAP